MSGVHRSEHAQREAPTRTTTQQHEPNARPPAALRLPELLGNQAFMRRRGVCVQRDGHGVPAPATVHRLARAGTAGPGHALPHLDVLQRSFGAHDLSGVATHTGAATRSAARGMQARAFTMGEHVGLDAGADLRTVAHEAAHVVQQRGGTGPADGVGRPGDRFERHADHVADLVVRGRSAEAALGAPTRPGAGAVALQREVDEQALIDADQPLRAPDTLTQDRECAVTGKLAANAGHNQYVSVQERLTLRRGARLRIQSENADQATIRTARWNNRAGGYDQYEGTIPTDNIRRGSTEQTPIDDPASIIPASVDDVHQEDVYQAGLSDCYFQAALLSLAHESPGAILDMLRVRDNGDIEVRLYERHWRTYEPTATWIAVKRSLFTADNGDLVYHGRRDHLLWPAFVSKAWAVHKGGWSKVEMGLASTAMFALTGRNSTASSVDRLETRLGWVRTPEEAFRTYERIRGGLDAHKPVALGTGSFAKRGFKALLNARKPTATWATRSLPAGNVRNLHAYAVLDITPRTLTADDFARSMPTVRVTLRDPRNPNGLTFTRTLKDILTSGKWNSLSYEL